MARTPDAATTLDEALSCLLAFCPAHAEIVEAELRRVRAAAEKVADAYTAEAEDWNDGELALWRKDDLVNAIVNLRQVLGER